MVDYGLVFAAAFLLLVGTAYAIAPQAMFYIRHFPFSSGNGLTEDGRRSYRLQGYFILLLGIGALIGAFVL